MTFTIPGNQEDPHGNPIPYFRTTQGSQWKKGAKRYHAWKDYVRQRYLDTKPEDLQQAILRTMQGGKPIELVSGETAEMHVLIWFKNLAHADADNIFKGIADALFVNDKYIRKQSAEYFYSDEKRGRVEVTILRTPKRVQ